MAKPKGLVTRERRQKARRRREWKAAQVAKIVELAQRPVTAENADELLAEIKASVSAPPRYLASFPRDFKPEDVLSIQRDLRAGLMMIVAGEGWVLPPVQRTVDNGGCYLSGPLASIFLNYCADLLAGEQRIARCQGVDEHRSPSGPVQDVPCQTVIVRRKGGAFCRVHGGTKTRGRRYRKRLSLRLTPELLRERRHRYYKRRVEKLKGGKAARKVGQRQRTAATGANEGPFVVEPQAPEVALEIVLPPPSPHADFGSWLEYQLEQDSRLLKRRMAQTLTSREENILRAAHGIRCGRVSIADIVSARREVDGEGENEVRVRDALRRAEEKLRASYTCEVAALARKP